MMQKFKGMLVGAVLAASAMGAQAATLDDVVPDGATTITGSAMFNWFSGMMTALNPLGPGTLTDAGSGLSAPVFWASTVDPVTGAVNGIAGSFPDPATGAMVADTATLIDYRVELGVLRALLQQASDGDYALATLSGITGGDWANQADGTYTAAYLIQPASVAPIPLPLSGLLLVSGLGGLAVLRRRKGA